MRLELDSTLTGPGHIVILVLVGLFLAGSATFLGAKAWKLAASWLKTSDRRVGVVRLLVRVTFHSAAAGVLIYLLLLNLIWPAPSAIVLDDRNLVIEYAFPGGTHSVARAEVKGVEFETAYVGIGERPRTRRAIIRIHTADGDIVLQAGRRGLEQRWQDAARQLSATLWGGTRGRESLLRRPFSSSGPSSSLFMCDAPLTVPEPARLHRA